MSYNYLCSLFEYLNSSLYRMCETYPKNHAIPHKLSTLDAHICDYSGKVEKDLYIQYLPYTYHYGIISSEYYLEYAKYDCYTFCKKNNHFPISIDFLIRNNFSDLYYATSGGCKNYRIMTHTTTFMSNGKKFYSQFYTNNRIIIFGEDKKIVSKGTYFDGGRTVVLDNGKQSSDESVWKNLLNLVSNGK